MAEFLTPDTKVIIMLCGYLGQDTTIKPLTQTEYTRLVSWLVRVKKRPENLLDSGLEAMAAEGSGIEKSRLSNLLKRGVQLGFAVETWERNGIWVMSRSDHHYPGCLKKHLKDKAPPLLFGVGDQALLRCGGLGIVGSRNVDEMGELFTQEAARLCASNSMTVISGGARGVDQIAMTTALECGGRVVGILADSLLKKSVTRLYRKPLANGQLILLSPFHPNSSFSVGNAMSRNKLIYAFSDFTLVVSAEYNNGGTWAGATEELKRDHARPVFVRDEGKVPSGNKKLLGLGGVAWPRQTSRGGLMDQLQELSAKKNDVQETPGLFDAQVTRQANQVKAAAPKSNFSKSRISDLSKNQPKPTEQAVNRTVYQAVLPVILRELDRPMSIEELATKLDVVPSQVKVWLGKAIAEHMVEKLKRPVRYRKMQDKTSPHAESGKQSIDSVT